MDPVYMFNLINVATLLYLSVDVKYGFATIKIVYFCLLFYPYFKK